VRFDAGVKIRAAPALGAKPVRKQPATTWRPAGGA
jgi:hypothetical protein